MKGDDVNKALTQSQKYIAFSLKERKVKTTDTFDGNDRPPGDRTVNNKISAIQ